MICFQVNDTLSRILYAFRYMKCFHVYDMLSGMIYRLKIYMEINKQNFAIKYGEQNSEIWIQMAKVWTKITIFN